MKRIAFISDVHANMEALIAVLADIQTKNVDEIYCLGDLVGYGPEPNNVIEEINKRNIITIKGNYDEAVGNEKEDCGCSYSPGRETEIGNTSLNWTIKKTTTKNKEFLKKLPKLLKIEIESVKFLLVHGSPLNPLFEYIHTNLPAKRLKELIKVTDADVIVSGHTHRMFAKHLLGKTLLNPGSVGRTKDGFQGASYLIVELCEGVYSYSFHIVKYDVKTTIEKIVKAGLPQEFATVLALGGTFDMYRLESCDSKRNKHTFYI